MMNFAQLRARFVQEFGHQEGIRVFFAPGRVNLIGEHTDYNGGYVFPAALTLGTWALVSPRADGVYRFRSTNFAKQAECRMADVQYKREDDWANYPKGVLRELLERKIPALAEHLRGADMLFHGNIPNGAGLSSSASIELVTAVALTKMASADIAMLESVKLAQRVENQFVGVNCGIMDQLAVGLGKKDHAIMLKCDTLTYQYVPFRTDGYKLVITNTNKRRELADSKYNERRKECEEGLWYIQKVLPGVHSLGDVTYEQWRNIGQVIPSEVIRHRVEHVIRENERVLLATNCLQHNDLCAFGQWMKKSHESLRDLYEVTGVELDALFEEASNVEGCIGTRMTGAGFGGCNVSLVKDNAVELFQAIVAKNYHAKTGLHAAFYVCDIGDGAKEITQEVELWPF